MKPLIICVAMTILLLFFSIYQQDLNTLIRQQNSLKYIADECANSASLYYDIDNYSEGLKVFDQANGIIAIEYLLKRNLHLSEGFIASENSYWKNTIEYEVYFFDYSNSRFPIMFRSRETGYEKLLIEPTVIVEIKAEVDKFRLNDFRINEIIRCSAYEYLPNI